MIENLPCKIRHKTKMPSNTMLVGIAKEAPDSMLRQKIR